MPSTAEAWNEGRYLKSYLRYIVLSYSIRIHVHICLSQLRKSLKVHIPAPVEVVRCRHRMDDKGKGFSLRHKKTSRAGPKQISKPAPKTTRPNGVPEIAKEIPPQRPRLGGGTSDLVKRRYSTRFNQLPDFSNADAPPMPNLPVPQQKRRSRTPSPTKQKVTVDVTALKDPRLQADKCKTSVLKQQMVRERTNVAGRLYDSTVGCLGSRPP